MKVRYPHMILDVQNFLVQLNLMNHDLKHLRTLNKNCSWYNAFASFSTKHSDHTLNLLRLELRVREWWRGGGGALQAHQLLDTCNFEKTVKNEFQIC